jgi:hypothetical protein
VNQKAELAQIVDRVMGDVGEGLLVAFGKFQADLAFLQSVFDQDCVHVHARVFVFTETASVQLEKEFGALGGAQRHEFCRPACARGRFQMRQKALARGPDSEDHP